MVPLGAISNDDIKTVGAAATTVGVLVALFGPSLRHWWRSPTLTLQFDPKRNGPHWDRVPVTKDDFFLRARVRNARRCEAAQDVQVLVTAYQAETLGLGGRPLEWSGLRERGRAPVTSVQIPAGLDRHVDIVQISQRSTSAVALDQEGNLAAETGPTRVDARLCVYPKPWGGSHRLPVGDHDVSVTITAANADSVSYRFTISFNGSVEADLSSPPKRENRRSLGELSRSWLKLFLAGFRPSRT